MRLARSISLGAATAVAIGVAGIAGAADSWQSATPAEIVVTYTHAVIPSNCDVNSARALLKTYHWPGTRKLARLQLAAMRAAGIGGIRIFLWHLGEPAVNDTNNLPSAGGRLVQPYRANLTQFVSDIRNAGFTSLMTVYGPQWTNNPLGDWQPNGVVNDIWDPSKLDENWSFISDTRALIEQYGPAESWFDVTTEMAPSDYVEARLAQRLDGYISEVYRRYVAAFGKSDLVFSVIGKSPQARETTTERFDNLVRILRSTGLGMPPRFAVHPDQTAPSIGMRAAADAMRKNGLDQPLVIGEMIAEGPSSEAVARQIADFGRTTDRRIPQVYLWWWRSDLEPHQCLSAPYRADSYIAALAGSGPSWTLHASVNAGHADLRTAEGRAVTALTSGRYKVAVTDGTAKAGFRLDGPGVDKTTGRRFRGTTAWSVTLRGGTYRFRADGLARESAGRFEVLPVR